MSPEETAQVCGHLYPNHSFRLHGNNHFNLVPDVGSEFVYFEQCQPIYSLMLGNLTCVYNGNQKTWRDKDGNVISAAGSAFMRVETLAQLLSPPPPEPMAEPEVVTQPAPVETKSKGKGGAG